MTPTALAALHAQCFDTPPPWSARSFADLLTSPHVFLIADPQGRAFILGRAIVDEAELLTLATDPAIRRAGLARGLMTAFEAEAERRGATRIFLEVAENNLAARSLYAACGFVQNGQRPGYYATEHGANITAMTLCKSLV